MDSWAREYGREAAMTQSSTNADTQKKRLWFIFLAGPVVYAIYFLAVYVLGEFGCFAGIQRLSVLGISPIRLGVMVLTLIAALATLSTGLTAFRRWRRLHQGEADPDEDDPKFMLFVGLWLNGLFTATILLTAVPMLLGSACDWI